MIASEHLGKAWPRGPPGSANANMETAGLGALQYILPPPLEFSRPTRKKSRVNGII